MRIISSKTCALAAVAVVGFMSVAGCTDSKYDFDEIDSTIGIGGDGLTLPGSSTDTIQLSEVLDIDDSESVVTRDNGDYVFTQDGGEVDPAHPTINKVTLTEDDVQSFGLPLTSSEVEGDVQAFTYSDTWPEGVIELTGAESTETFELTISFSTELRTNIPMLEELTLTFPGYMVLDNVTSGVGSPVTNGNIITFKNLSTASDVKVQGNVVRMDFTADKTLGQLRHDVTNDKMVLDGSVRMYVKSTGSHGTDRVITTQMTIHQFDIVEVTGFFDPDIDLNNLGDVNITGVPDFLSDDGVKLDIYNPQILLTISNDMDIDGIIENGVLTSYDENGRVMATVNVPNIAIGRNGTTNACICRSAAALVEEFGANHGYTVAETPDLSKLIETIPDKITFDADVVANSANEGSFVLGKTDYTVETKYNIEAPLAFADDAQIVYNDTLDEWHEDIEDIEFKEGSYLHLTGHIANCIPAYLNISATPIDVNGNVCSGANVTIVKGDAVASSDGVNKAESDLEIKIDGDIRDLDGLVLKITASAKDNSGSNGTTVTGITLNSQKHYIIVDDIVIRLEGGLVIDMN